MDSIPFIETIRRGTAAEWAASTYVLRLGEPALDTTNNIVRYGDGERLWKDLPNPYRSEYAPADYATADDITGLFGSAAG